MFDLQAFGGSLPELLGRIQEFVRIENTLGIQDCLNLMH